MAQTQNSSKFYKTTFEHIQSSDVFDCEWVRWRLAEPALPNMVPWARSLHGAPIRGCVGGR